MATKKKTSSKAIIKRASTDVPAYLQVPDEELGADFDSSDIVVPRIKICQAMSSAIKEANPKIKEGQFYNTVTQEAVDPLAMFVLLFWKSRVWFSKDFKMLGTIYTDTLTKESIEFGQDIEFCKKNWDEGLDAFNYMVITETDLIDSIKTKQIQFPAIYSAMSAACGKARQLNGKLKTNSMKQIPIYGQLIHVSTNIQKFSAGQAYMPAFDFGRYADKTEFLFLKELHTKCKALQRRTETHHDEESTEEAEKDNLNDGKTTF